MSGENTVRTYPSDRQGSTITTTSGAVVILGRSRADDALYIQQPRGWVLLAQREAVVGGLVLDTLPIIHNEILTR